MPDDRDIIGDPSDLRRYRTELPNLICDLELTPYELALYVHLKRTAGAGRTGHSRKSTKTLAKESKMSEGQIIDAKKSLAEKGLIRIVKRVQGETDLIMIEDIWAENFAKFAKPASRLEPDDTAHTVSSATHTVSDNHSHSERKNKQIMKNKPNEEGSDPPSASLTLAEAKPKDPLLQSFLDLFEFDHKIFAQKDWFILQSFLKAFRKANVTVAQVEQYKDWHYKHFWKGQQGQPPNYQDVKANWKLAFSEPKPITKKESQYETRAERREREWGEFFNEMRAETAPIQQKLSNQTDNNGVPAGRRLLRAHKFYGA